MYKKSHLQPILLGLITLLFAAACDKDFNELGTDIVGDDHYGFDVDSLSTVKAYNQKLGPIASNNLAVNTLGIYTNPAFGTTHANFVTQVELTTLNPKFNNKTIGDYGVLPIIDSVIVDIPYFSHIKKNSTTAADGSKAYLLDSIYGSPASKFKLGIFRSNYFLRELDPNQSLSESQVFYSDENSTISSNIIGAALNDAPKTDETDDGIDNEDGQENSDFFFDKTEHILKVKKEDGTFGTPTRTAPSMRLHLNKAVFYDAILNAPEGKLLNNAVFKNYFRGLYFKVEGATGHMASINFRAGKITIYYREDKKETTTPVTFTKVSKTYVLNLNGNTISLLNNSAENPDYLNAANNTGEASKLYLKGGEGSVGMVDLFGDPNDSSYDTYGFAVYKNTAGVPIDENDEIIPLDANNEPLANHYLLYKKVNTPNTIADELDDLRYPEHVTKSGITYYSKKNRWMINEASLIFNIDAPGVMQNPDVIEPGRIFVYDLTNKRGIFDYTYDGTSNILFPKFNKGVFGGILLDGKGKTLKQKDDATNLYVNKGKKYKIRITNHIRNLIKNDSTNVRIGVAVTENINNIGFAKLRTPNANFKSAPSMSVMNPLGTILYGTGSSAPADKKLKLKIYYTKPKNN